MAVGRVDNMPLRASDVADSPTVFPLSSYNITGVTSIGGIECLSALTILEVGGNPISDLSPVRNASSTLYYVAAWEWSLDYWTETYPTAAQKNYAKLDSGTYRAVRGGSYDNTAKLVSAAARTGMMPTIHYDTVGFRCARNLR